MPARERGIVKWFNDETGCGFICRPDNRGDAYVVSAFLRDHVTLYDGQDVEFEPVSGLHGIEAHDVIGAN